MRTHQEIDARSLAMHRLVVEKIRRDPALLARAESTLSRWRKTVALRRNLICGNGSICFSKASRRALPSLPRTPKERQLCGSARRLRESSRTRSGSRFCGIGAGTVKRSELEHLIRAAAAITDQYEIVVVGSQSILGAFPDAPDSLLLSEQFVSIPEAVRVRLRRWLDARSQERE